MKNDDDDRLINLDELLSIVPLSDSGVRRLEAEGKFPRRIKIGRRALWSRNDVLEWIRKYSSE